MSELALIVGAGSGLSASLARLFHKNGLRIALAARNTEKLESLQNELGATVIACDSSNIGDVERLFGELDTAVGAPEIVVYNPSARARGPLIDLDPEQVKHAIMVTAFGAFLVAQQATKRMLPKGRGAILFTGASAGVKGYPRSSSFAMGKFAMRGLAQSLARELHPQGIHIGHFVIDGGIQNPDRPGYIATADNPDSLLDPDAIAQSYWHFIQQPRSSWAWEIELRPWVETF